jgi:hypothetical protein
MPDRLAQHGGHHPVGGLLDELEPETSADAVAHVEELLALMDHLGYHRKSSLNASIALNTALGQLLTREFNPPPGVS